MNRAFCNLCKKLVPATPAERDGKIFLVKECPDCGRNETYISSDAARYYSKHALDVDFEYKGCSTDCEHCKHSRAIRFAFVNVTNRCNTNCPICFDNVPGLGFAFEPPIEYFDHLFKWLAEQNPRPTVCLFGGEPTVREDLFDIIKLSKSYRLRTRLYTNGIRLANEDYCRKLVQSHVHILISYDGADPNTYAVLRGNPKFVELKQKAIENIGKMGDIRRGKLTLVWVLSKGLNDQSIPEMLEFCHSRSDFVGDVYLMPLCHTWDTAKWDYNPDRLTTEDAEALVAGAFPEYNLQFIPLGFVSQLEALTEASGRNSYGAHPNCESIYYLVSDGKKYMPLERYLKGSLPDLAAATLKLDKRLAAMRTTWIGGRFGRVLNALRLKGFVNRLLTLGALGLFIPRHVRLGDLLEGNGIGKAWHLVALPVELLFRRKKREALYRHTRIKGRLMLVVLPLEDTHVLETDRLERCPTGQAYYDPRAQQGRFIPLCAWKLHNRKILRGLADYYAAEK